MKTFPVFVVVIAILWAILLIATITANNFESRCAKAGYEGAAHERCVYRLSSGGPVYEENIEFFKNGH